MDIEHPNVFSQLVEYLRSVWKREMTQEDLNAIDGEIMLKFNVDRPTLMKALDQVGKEQLAFVQRKRVIDFEEKCTPDKVVEGFEIRKITVPINEWSHKVVYNLINFGVKYMLPANSYCLIMNTQDEPLIRSDFDQYVILKAAHHIDFEAVIEEDGITRTQMEKLEIFDRGCYQPTVIIDADYPGAYFFTIRNDTDEPSELHSLIVEAYHINKSLVPRVDHDTTYRLPIVQCQPCLSMPHDMFSTLRHGDFLHVSQLLRGSTRAAGLDLVTDPFVLHPRGIKVFYLARFFKYREMENSPDQFVLRSRMSREGMSVTVTTETINDESLIKFVVTNNTDCEMQVPNRFIQFLPPVTMHINNELVSCEDPSHNFLYQKNKSRKSKL